MIGPGPTLAIDAVASCSRASASSSSAAELLAPTDRPETHILTDIREGIEFIVHHPTLRSAIGFWGIVSITTAPLVPALTVYITRDLGSRGLGPRCAPRRVRRRDRHRGARDLAAPSRFSGPVLLGGNLARGLVLVGIGLAGHVELLLPLGFVAGIADSAVLSRT